MSRVLNIALDRLALLSLTSFTICVIYILKLGHKEPINIVNNILTDPISSMGYQLLYYMSMVIVAHYSLLSLETFGLDNKGLSWVLILLAVFQFG